MGHRKCQRRPLRHEQCQVDAEDVFELSPRMPQCLRWQGIGMSMQMGVRRLSRSIDIDWSGTIAFVKPLDFTLVTEEEAEAANSKIK